MATYISILRGINVSGQKKILMNELKILFEKEGFKNIVTYIQSGNVIFEAGKKVYYVYFRLCRGHTKSPMQNQRLHLS